MMKHLRYLKYVLLHKWYVFQECRKLDVPLWTALVHDWHKFLPSEWFPYVTRWQEYGGVSDDELPGDVRERYYAAWNAHVNRGKHHWQYWILDLDDGGRIVQPVPDVYRREMLADWRAAGRAQGKGDNTIPWFLARAATMKLNPETHRWILRQLGVRGSACPCCGVQEGMMHNEDCPIMQEKQRLHG